MADIDFPNSPSVNQTFTVGERTWKWTGSTWDVVVTTQITGPQGPQGIQGNSGVISVTSPITNTGTSNSAVLGINQSLISISESQVANLTSDLAAKAPISSPTFTGTVSGITKAMVGLGNVDNTTDLNKPISTATQTALDLKLDSSTATSTYLTIANAASTYLTQSNATSTFVSLTGSYSNPSWITGLAWSKISSTPTTLSGYGITDALTSTVIASTYAPLASPTFTGTVSGITKSMIGLGNVDNTTDANKPISTATQTALNLKLDSATAASTYALISHSHGNITNSGAIGSTSGLVAVTTTSGALTVAPTPGSAATQFLRGDLTWVVPTDTNTYPTAFAWTAGTTAGPTGSLTGTMTTVSYPAIPSAGTGASGIVTTGTQNFDGVKTFNSFPQVASGTPSQALELVTKQYVDNIASGINAHDAVVAATTGALTATYNNNTTGIGATLTNSGAQSALVIDNVSLLSGDRVLVKNQATTLQNGIYVVTTVGTGSTNWVLTRASDYDQSVVGEVAAGDTTFVIAHSSQFSTTPTNQNTGWTMNSPGAITIGSSAITFVQSSGTGTVTAGTGISVTGNQVSVDSTVLTTSSTQTAISNKSFTAPVLGSATATSINKVAITAPATGSTLTIADGKTLTASNTLTFTGTDSSTLNIGSGGTLGTGAYATIANYALLAGGNSFTGAQTISTSGAPTAVGLSLTGDASQTANLFSATGTTGSVTINNLGNLTTAASPTVPGLRNPSVVTVLSLNTAGYTLSSTNPTASNIALRVQGAASQTGDLTQWQDSTGVVLAKVIADGSVRSGSFGSLTAGMALMSPGADTGAFVVTTQTATNKGLAIRGAASQSANFFEIQDSTAALLGQFTSGSSWKVAGGLVAGGVSGGAVGVLSGYVTTATTLGLYLRGFANQTSDLQQMQNSSSVTIAGINANGQTYTGSTTPLITAVGGTIQSIATGANPLVTMASAHGLAVGDLITLASTTGATYDGKFVVATVPLTTTFTITSALTTGQAAAAGTVSVPAQVSINIRSAGTTGLLIKSATSQLSPILDLQNAVGTSIFGVTNAGGLTYAGTTVMVLASGRNAQFASATASFGGGLGVIGIANAATTPTSNPTGGGVLYVNSGALSYIGTSGSGQAIINADGTSPFAKLAGGNSFTGNQIIAPGAGSTPGLTINATTGTTGYPIEVFDGTGNRRFIVTEFGSTIIGGNTNFGGRLNVQPTNTTTVGQIIRGATSATADLLVYQNSSATTIGGRNALGQIYTGSASPITGNTVTALTAASASSTTVATYTYGTVSTSNQVAVGQLVTITGFTAETYFNGTFAITAIGGSSGAWTFTVVGTGFTVASATVLGSYVLAAQASITPYSLGTAGLVIKANSGQSANLVEWQSSAGAILARVNNVGAFVTGSVAVVGANSNTPNAQLFVLNGTAANPAAVIKGAASQSANLQEWQESNGGVPTSVNATGQLRVRGFANSFGFTALGVAAAAATEIPAVIRGAASQSANLQEWQNSAGSTLAKVDNNGNFTIGANLTFLNPGIGNETKFTFAKTNDNAWLKVTERSGDLTAYEFGMSDNPDSGDYFQWRFDDYQSSGSGWMPLQMGGFNTRFIAANNNMYGNVSMPFNTGFYTFNSGFGGTDQEVNRYAPSTNSSTQHTKDSGTGTGTLTVNPTGYTGANYTVYWVVIETGGTTFKWGTGWWNSGTSVATGVAITGAAQLLQNGVYVTLSLTGHVAGDRWAWRMFSAPQFAVGGGALTSVAASVFPKADYIGLAVRGASSQTANLQEWQNNSGTILSRISSTGQFVSDQQTYIGSGATGISNARFNVATGSASVIGQVVKGAASQTADLQQWQTSDAVVHAGINASGFLFVGGSASPGGQLGVQAETATNRPLVVKGAASQSANLTEWQNSAGSILMSINQYGAFTNNSSGNRLNSDNSANAILIIKNITGQYGDQLQYWNAGSGIQGGRNANAQIYTGSTAPLTTAVGGATTAASGDGTTATLTTTSNHNLAVGDRITVAGVTPTGYNGTYIVTAAATNSVSYANTTTGAQTVAGTVSVDAQVSITSRSAATPTLFMRMASAQTSAPFEIQTSAGVTVARINSSGQFSISTLNNATDSLTNIVLSGNRNIQLAGNTASHGGGTAVIGISNASAVPTSNPTGGGILYADSGALAYRGTSGSSATIVNADGTRTLDGGSA